VNLSLQNPICTRAQFLGTGFSKRSMRSVLGVVALFCALLVKAQPVNTAITDPYLWLEDVQGDKALAWVRQHNATATALLEAAPMFADNRAKVQAVLDNREQIPGISRRGNFFYNFWRDAQNPRGLWRRTTLDEYRKAKPQWDVLLDLDALGQAEGENWVWAGANCLAPDYNRCLISISRGGADAKVTREFDVNKREFVKDGFFVPEAKSRLDWIDINSVYVATDFGPGSMTKSGYPRVIKRWQRGTPLTAAVQVFAGQESDVSAFVSVDKTPGFERTTFGRSTDFYNTEVNLLVNGQLVKIDKPSDAVLSWQREWAFLLLKSDLKVAATTYKSGSLLGIPFDALMKGERNYQVLFEPTATRSLARSGPSSTRDFLLLNILDNVAGRIEELQYVAGQWQRREVKAPFPGTLSASGMHDPFVKNDPLANHYIMSYLDFLTPASLYLGKTGSDQQELLKSNPIFFDKAGMRTEQRFAKSKDGTQVPYFVVYPKNYKADGSNPTVLYGYGGYQISMEPFYSGSWGTTWYQRGGVFVVANIRGGGEFGPAWHQSAIKQNKQKSYDDFAAVAEDLIKSGITQAKHLGIMGGSNGGLLVGAVMVQRPELFGAVVCSVPLLDMQRYHKLLAGNSWMAEYGNPDKPEEWAYISQYSPYQNVKKGVKYPKVLFATSTRDDRVHPGHARKMAARMMEQGHDVLYYENIEGGHGGAANNAQRANLVALENTFLWLSLGGQ
jgi:prolyl oligopeptidase